MDEQILKRAALDAGADLVGVATLERLRDGPPSADLTYLLPSARSLVSFAVALDRDALRAFFAKTDWLAHGVDRKRKEQTLYGVADRLTGLLQAAGHEALAVNVNDSYRPEDGSSDVVRMREFLPDFAHRYGALAAGLGRLGWSGNLITPRHGSAVTLGTVLTSAALAPDPLCAENPCDRCKLCAVVCPVEMISTRQSVEVTVAGVTEELAAKSTNERCWIGCGDYHGLGPNGRWSNWSPFRLDYPLPEDDDALHALAARLRAADPHTNLAPDEINPFTDYRAAVLSPQWRMTPTCGHCANICWADRQDRKENRRLIHGSGVVALAADGRRTPTRRPVVEVDTPLGSRVAVIDEPMDAPAGRASPRDAAALDAVRRWGK